MSINKNRKFHFSFGNFVENTINPDNETNSAVTVQFKDITIHNPNRDNQQSQMDPQTQAKLSAMAKQAKANGGNSTGMDAEYLTKVPAKQHNQITMLCAGDKLKELNDKMNEEINSNAGDAGTADILSETANDHILYKDYNIDDLDQYIKKIDSMTMLEAISLKNSIAKELNRLESCHTMVKAVDDLRQNFDIVSPDKTPTMMDRKSAGTDVDKQILTANYLDEYGYTESADEFAKLYDTYKPKLEELSNALTVHINECEPNAASTKYMTEDFLQIINKRLNNLHPSDKNYDYLYKSLGTLKDAFENRTDIKFLNNKMRLFVQNKTHMKNLAKAMNGTFSGIAAKLNKNFATKTMSSFINAMHDCFDGDLYNILPLLYFLNYVCTSESKNNGDAWVKVFVLNVSDIRKGIWDLDEHYDSYLARMANTFYPKLDEMKEYLMKRKIKFNSQIIAQYEFFMNWKEPKKEEN